MARRPAAESDAKSSTTIAIRRDQFDLLLDVVYARRKARKGNASVSSIVRDLIDAQADKLRAEADALLKKR